MLWLLQWPVRAVVLLIVAALPLGVEVDGFIAALVSAVAIGLLGTLLVLPLKAVLALPWAITSLGGLIAPVSWLYNWLITVLLFALAAWLILVANVALLCSARCVTSGRAMGVAGLLAIFPAWDESLLTMRWRVAVRSGCA